MFREMTAPNRKAVMDWMLAHRADPAAPRPSQADNAAYEAGLMAEGYAWALAAVLGEAVKVLPADQAQRLACIADGILMNGDGDGYNADVSAGAVA
jgi:hypothetical protein